MDFCMDTTPCGAESHPRFFDSAFYAGEVFTPDLNGLDFVFSPHGLWPPEKILDQDSCFLGLDDPGSVAPAVTPIACSFGQVNTPESKSNAESTPSPAPTTPQKRKKATTKTHSKKQQKTGSGQRSPRAEAACNPAPSKRAHYAVEKRYRSTLNDRYATLARIISQPETQEICRTESKEWEVPHKLDRSNSGSESGPSRRQSKTTTLSIAIEAIALLDRCCVRKAKEYQSLVCRLNGIVKSAPLNFDKSGKK